MLHLIVNWLLSALALWLVARIIPGIEVRDFGAALVATVIIAIVNFFFGPILRFSADLPDARAVLAGD
jgi:putative membrane protein